MPEIRKILVPTDFSQNSLRALDYAVGLAERYAAEIVVVHVLELPIYPAMSFGSGSISLPALQEEMREAVNAQLARVMEEHLADTRATSILREGTAFVEIIEAAREQNADMIVLGTQGNSAFKQLLLGSTAERVVRKAPCPVLTIRDSEHESTAP